MAAVDAALGVDPEIAARASRVRLLILDVDGVLTDGRVLVVSDGRDAREFNARDGLGIRLGQRAVRARARRRATTERSPSAPTTMSARNSPVGPPSVVTPRTRLAESRITSVTRHPSMTSTPAARARRCSTSSSSSRRIDRPASRYALKPCAPA